MSKTLFLILLILGLWLAFSGGGGFGGFGGLFPRGNGFTGNRGGGITQTTTKPAGSGFVSSRGGGFTGR